MNMKTLTETSTFRVLSLLLCLCFFIPAMYGAQNEAYKTIY